jgi:hypothetical protein
MIHKVHIGKFFKNPKDPKEEEKKKFGFPRVYTYIYVIIKK